MGQIASTRAPLLPDFTSSFWLSDLKAAQRLIQRFTKIQSEFGFAIQYQTFVKLYSPEPSTAAKPPAAEYQRVFAVWDPLNTGKTDALQIFAGSLMCCRGSFQSKVIALFELFDMDMNGHISRDEMTILIRASLNGFCKMSGVDVPSLEELAEMAKLSFKSADRQEQKDNRIEKKELLRWALCTPECVNLLCRFGTTDGNEVRKQLKAALIEEREYIRPLKPPIPTIQKTLATTTNNGNNSNGNGQDDSKQRANDSKDEKESSSSSSSSPSSSSEPAPSPLNAKEKAKLVKRIDESRLLKRIFDSVDIKQEGFVPIPEFNLALKKNESELAKFSTGNASNPAGKRGSVMAGTGGAAATLPLRSFELSFAQAANSTAGAGGKSPNVLVLAFRDILKAWYGESINKRELEYLLSQLVVKPVPETIVKKIKGIFDELDRDFSGKVNFSNIMAVLAPSSKLAEYISVQPILERFGVDLNAHETNTLPDAKKKTGPTPVTAAPAGRNAPGKRAPSVSVPVPHVSEDLVTLTDLLMRLFEPTHKHQLSEILAWGKPSRVLTAEQKKDLVLLFELYDKDGSGFIDFEELKSSAIQFNSNMADNELIHLFSTLDLNGDDRISLFEFMRFYRALWDSSVNFRSDLFRSKIKQTK